MTDKNHKVFNYRIHKCIFKSNKGNCAILESWKKEKKTPL